MNQADRLLIIGCAGAAIGIALAVFGAFGTGGDWVITALGLAAALSALPTSAVALKARRRTATASQTSPRTVRWRAIIDPYIQETRRSRKRRVVAAVAALWIIYNVIALVASIAMNKWAYALIYGVVAAALVVLAYVRAVPKSPAA